MNQHELIEQLAAAGHDISGYEVTKPPPRKKKAPSVASISIDELAEAIDEAIARYVEPLEKRIKELEAKPSLRYCGVWNGSTQYAVGDFCTHEGSLWHCNVSTIGTRPSDTRDWQLAVKRGRDGR